jgi:hypothetical protein
MQPQFSPSLAEPGVHVHANGDVKIQLAFARGASQLPDGTIALTAKLIDRLYAASHARRGAAKAS